MGHWMFHFFWSSMIHKIIAKKRIISRTKYCVYNAIFFQQNSFSSSKYNTHTRRKSFTIFFLHFFITKKKYSFDSFHILFFQIQLKTVLWTTTKKKLDEKETHFVCYNEEFVLFTTIQMNLNAVSCAFVRVCLCVVPILYCI